MWSLCPKVFREELKKAFFRLFEVDRYHKIIGGAEYKKTLRKGFPELSDNDKREYAQRVIVYFKKRAEEKEDEDWHLSNGSRILSMVSDYLDTNQELRQEAENAGFKITKAYEPEPTLVPGLSGTVVARGPISRAEFGKLPIEEIGRRLRDEWTPEKLVKQNTGADFLNPLNAEGAGELLRNDLPERLQEYVDNAGKFFERGVLDSHYTYSYLRGIREAIENNREESSKVIWDRLIDLFTAIKDSTRQEPFARQTREGDPFDAWLADWDAVHSAMTDIVRALLNEQNESVVIDFPKYRDQILEILTYLLAHPDPDSEDERHDTAKIKTKMSSDTDYEASDPFTIAINSVRGRAYEAFVLFVYQDGKKFKKSDKVKISRDVKKLYEDVLKKENTRALMFMFGYYLPTFYYRDRDWIRGLLPQIFPYDQTRKHLYTAAWEGYLANNLYEEIFFDPEFQKLYERGLSLTDADYPKQRHFKKPDEGIADHLAIAYMYYSGFGFGYPLFEAFWEKKDSKQHAQFVDFLGRLFLSGDNESADKLLEKEPDRKQRLKDLWDWLLEKYPDPRPFNEFGFWINLKKDIFEPAWLAERTRKTLVKTSGSLDWDLGLMESIAILAEAAPADTLEILRLYLLEGCVRGSKPHLPFHIDQEWYEALGILYRNSDEKIRRGVVTLIDDLIREGGSSFWGFKKILEENDQLPI